ncbi:MAG: D-lyxose/D-mannose family sugar isomerase [Lachnospiraceae bacterium]|nr:D-lyxose/D-mannose family sugar isomerase [Lachnospiraceae bacterium]
MKRSEINKVIKKFEAFLAEYKFALPPYLSFTPEEWAEKGHEYDEIRENKLGWDVTDYGEGHFDTLGLALITIRNGNVKMADKYPKPYAEKIMMCDSGQISPMHFHWGKMEDIINRGGNDVVFTFYNANKETEEFEDTDVLLMKDGRQYRVPAGSQVALKPGESFTLYPYLYHEFIIPEGGPALIGEVSTCNDDDTDNRFKEPLGRFPTIEEDEPPYRLLCTEYPPAKD